MTKTILRLLFNEYTFLICNQNTFVYCVKNGTHTYVGRVGRDGPFPTTCSHVIVKIHEIYGKKA